MRLIGTGIGLAALCISQMAMAQGQNSAATADEAGAGRAMAAMSGIKDIVVTAQKRAENVQKSSLSIEVVDTAELVKSNLTDAEGLSRLVPNLQIGNFAYSRIYLRGVGDNTVNGIAQSAVAFNVDGVHVARTSQFSGNFYDVARIEVLKGPQGTLYGRNASAGVVNVITNAPTFNFGGNVMLNVGNYDLLQTTGALNVPVTDNLAARFAYNVIRRDGYLEDGYNDAKQQSGRVRVLWEANPDLTVNLKADYTHSGGKGQGPVVFPAPAGADPWMASSGDLFRQYQEQSAPHVPDDGFVNNDYASVSAEVNANLGFANLTVIPAYRWQNFKFFAAPAGTLNFGEHDHTRQTSLEARLSRDTENLNLVLGGFYFHEYTRYDSQIDQSATSGTQVGTATILTQYRAPTDAIAFFADGRLTLFDGFRAIAGVRYTDEKRGLFGTTTTYSSVPSVPLCDPAIGPIDSRLYCVRGYPDNSVKNDAVTWRGGFEADLASNSMLYFTVDKGFKSGGIYSGAAPGNSYKPEFLTSFTGGIRNRFFNNTLQANVEAFYWDYKDYQFSFVNYDLRGVSAFVTRNAGAARLYGGNIDLVWQPIDSDTVRLNVEYLDTKFKQFTYSTPFPTDASRMCKSLGIVDRVTTPTGTVAPLFGHDCSGLPLPRAPKWLITAGWTHEFELANGGSLVFDFDGKFSSSYKLDFTAVEFMKQSHYALANAQIAYHAPNDNYEVAVWMRNITNQPVYNDARRFGSTNFSGADIGPPRTFGVRGQVRF